MADVIDPLAEVVALLQPTAPSSKLSSGAGRWRVRSATDKTFYCAILDGQSSIAVDGQPPVVLEKGDFVLVPQGLPFTASSVVPPKGARDTAYVVLPDGEIRHGDPNAPADVRMLVGHCAFGSPNAPLLLSLLPQLVHVRGEPRLHQLMQLVRDESRERRPARDVVLARLLEVLFIEALRSTAHASASPSLSRGLADERLAVALRCMHEAPTKAWTVAQLAKEAALSRSAFFERFSRTVGTAPMAYLLEWRMALAKDLLRREALSIGEIAKRVGYGSASSFSVAFTRHVGQPPTHYAR